ncbi:MAG TPA: hypothetical protein VER96_32155 [Polyangiaceae bacterium]|nr:hypothetical protein [Polyangiaceae bacterium]
MRQVWFCVLSLSCCFAGCHSPPATTSESNEASGGGDLEGGLPGASGGAASGGSMRGGSAGRGTTSASGGTTTSSACLVEPDLTPSFPAVTALDPDLVARAAAVIGSCMPDDGVMRNAAYLWNSHFAAPRLYYRYVEQLECLGNANCGCAAAEHCVGLTYRQAAADCLDRCEGNVFIGCGDGVEFSFDCGRVGLSCDPITVCVGEPGVGCDDSEPPSCTAEGDVRYCTNGTHRTTPCQSLGFSCEAGDCVGDGESCEPKSVTTEQVTPVGMGCSGTALRACLGGHTTQVDCAMQGPGFTCQERDGSFFCGLAAECVPSGAYSSNTTASCDGTTLSFCNAGRVEHIDCTELGFSGCTIDRKLDLFGCTPGPVQQ